MSKIFHIILIAVVLLTTAPSRAQQSPDGVPSQSSWFKRNNVLDHLDASVTLGTPGLGFEFAAPITQWVNVRAGFSAVPSFHVPLNFQVAAYADGNVSGNLDKIMDMMEKVTGERMEDNVKVIGKPAIWNAKLLFDVFPLRDNRHWHVTAGVYIGSSQIASAVNDRKATSTLVAMNLYNRFYDRLEGSNSFDEPFFGDIWLSPDMYEEFLSYGRMGIHLGETKDGRPYYLTPSSDGTVNARVKSHAVKPYLGIGYSTNLDKDRRWEFGVDAGVLFWGGAPQVILNDGTNMNKDLRHVRGKVGDYFNFIKGLPVFPDLSVRFTYHIL